MCYSLADGTTPLNMSATDYGNGATVTTTQSALIRFEIGILNGTACPSAGLTFKPMLEVGSMVHPFVSPVASEAASQSATKYVTQIDNAGIFVSPSNQSPTSLAAGNSVKINADGMYVYQGGVERAYFKADAAAIGTNGGNRSIMNSTGLHVYKLIDSTQTEVAFFGETARVGKASTQRVSITSTDVEMYSSDNVKRIAINASSGVTIGLSTKGHTIVNDTGLSVYDTNNKKRTSITSSGLNVYDTDGSTSVASFGSTARIGKTAAFHINVNTSDITFKDGSDSSIVKFGASTSGSNKYTDINMGNSRIRMHEASSWSNSSVALQVFGQGGSEEYGWTALLSGSDGLSVTHNYYYTGTTINDDVKTGYLYSGYKKSALGSNNILSTSSCTSGSSFSSVSVPTATWTSIGSFTLPLGTYILIANVSFPSNATGWRGANFNVSAGSNWVVSNCNAVNGQVTRLNLVQLVDVGRGRTGVDGEQATFYLNVYQNSGSTMSVSAEYWHVTIR